MNKELELHFSENGDPSFLLEGKSIDLTKENGHKIAMWSADFSLPLARKYDYTIEANKTGILINDENVSATIQDNDFNGFKTLTLRQNDWDLVLHPKEVIAFAGAMGNKILGERGVH